MSNNYTVLLELLLYVMFVLDKLESIVDVCA